MDVIVIVYKSRNTIEFISRTVKPSKFGNKIKTFTHLGTKNYKSAVQRRKDEMQIQQGAEIVFKEI